jgi:hypothetical protein
MDSYTLSEKVKTSISVARDHVLNGYVGTTSFVELHSNPLTGLYLQTLKEAKSSEQANEIEERVVPEPDHYPDKPEDVMDMINQEYAEYEKRCDDSGKEKRFSRFTWKKHFSDLRQVIEDATQQYEGIVCYENGDTPDNCSGNMLVLHVCDVINMFIEGAYNQRKPGLYLRTAMLGDLDTVTKITLFDDILTKNQLKFLVQEVDFVYAWFAYWNNKSILPIRTTVCKESTVFKKSAFFTNDKTFREHQEGKLRQLYIDRYCIETCINNYRCI